MGKKHASQYANFGWLRRQPEQTILISDYLKFNVSDLFSYL